MTVEAGKWDAIIVGGGPAGVSCAVWLQRLAISVLLLEAQPALGGLCRLNPFPDDWNAAVPGATGQDVAQRLACSARDADVPLRLSWRVESASERSDGVFELRSSSGKLVHGDHLVVASGVRARSLPELGGSAPRPGSGILIGPGSHVAGADFRGKRVAVLGGGDNAFENARYAREHGAASVHVHARNVRAGDHLIDGLAAEELSVGPYVVDPSMRTVNGRHYDLILVFYGWEPHAPFAEELGLARNDEGFIATEPASAQTSRAGVYAIGEVAQRLHPCVVTALADGVTAAKAIQARVEAARRTA